MNFCFYQLSLPCLIILETILFIETDNIQGVHFNFLTILVTGQYIVVENISTEYYTVKTASSSVSSNRASEPRAFTENQRKAIVHCPH